MSHFTRIHSRWTWLWQRISNAKLTEDSWRVHQTLTRLSDNPSVLEIAVIPGVAQIPRRKKEVRDEKNAKLSGESAFQKRFYFG
jgi:hypothetical protein